jgi:hypothetical protein
MFIAYRCYTQMKMPCAFVIFLKDNSNTNDKRVTRLKHYSLVVNYKNVRLETAVIRKKNNIET